MKSGNFYPFAVANSLSGNEDDIQYLLDHKISCAMIYKGKFVGYYLYMRSSSPINTPLRMANNVGIIDSGYRGNIRACFDIISSKKYIYI